eukprot:CAMPEP_0176485576 /NCGR_PEP_ID=MMETSP0200_2-20121128/5110_1 /TAXON_ID=947934 /ORGANISM="Chaetoceros sp., Strain GSL56" /LENGTH=662 /DNA_ID=CAMNT_0017882223 /DNA_START=3580 /DNA_END=5568 /DNA_ORIENTATION=+
MIMLLLSSNSKSFISLLLTLIAAQVSTSHAQLCHDSTSFRFPLEVVPRSQDCAWILKNRDVEFQKRRKERYCPLTHVKYACPLSCDACESSCEDNPHYLFQNENGETKNCAWIEKEDVELRRMLYCHAPRDSSSNSAHGIISATASEIGENCVSSCGFCKGGFGLAPSEVAWEQLGMDVGVRRVNEVGLSTTMSKDGNVVAVGVDKFFSSQYYYRLFFKCQNGKWCQIGDDIDAVYPEFGFGNSNNALSNDGKTFAVQTSTNTTRVYHWDGHSWEQRGEDLSFDGEIVSSSMSGDGKVLALITYYDPEDQDVSTFTKVYIYHWEDSSSSWKESNTDRISLGGQDTIINEQIVPLNEVASAQIIETFSSSLNDDGSVIAISYVILPTDVEIEFNELTAFIGVYEWTAGFSWCQRGERIMLKEQLNFQSVYIFNAILSGDGNVLAVGPETSFDFAPLDQQANSNNRLRKLIQRRAQIITVYPAPPSSIESFVHVYEWNGDSWNQRGSDIDGEDAIDGGMIVTTTLSGDGNVLAIGVNSPTNIESTLEIMNNSLFAVIAYQWNGSSWKQMGMDFGSVEFYAGPLNSLSSNYDGTMIAVGGGQWFGPSGVGDETPSVATKEEDNAENASSIPTNRKLVYVGPPPPMMDGFAKVYKATTRQQEVEEE